MKTMREILSETYEDDRRIKELVSKSPLKGNILQTFIQSVKNLDHAGLSRVITKIQPPGRNMALDNEDKWRVKYLMALRKSLRSGGLKEAKRVMVHVTGKPTPAERKEILRLLDYHKGEQEGNTDKGAIFSFEDEIDARLFSEMVNGRSRNIKGLSAETQ